MLFRRTAQYENGRKDQDQVKTENEILAELRVERYRWKTTGKTTAPEVP